MPNNKQPIKVSKKDLPASCPPKDTPAWDMHPRVYIELKKSQVSDCPYCGAQFELVSD